MRKKLFMALGLLLLLSSAAMSQTTGKIMGTVVDDSNGQPLPAANVMIEGTARGTASNMKGEFMLINVPPGEYNLIVQMMGYDTYRIEGLKISINRTATVDVRMKTTVLEGEVIVVRAEKSVVKKDQTSSIRNVSSDQIDVMPVEDLSAVISMQAGVVDGHFRGGRVTEVAYMIDGMQVTESFGGEHRSVDLEPEAIQDLEVITGTFNAEYGKAMSGVVNAVTKRGGKEFHGSFSAALANYITPHDDIFIGLKPGEIDRNQDYKGQLSGPILGDKVTFFANARYQKNKNHLNGIYRFNVYDYSNFESADPDQWFTMHTGDGSYVPMNNSENLSVTGKLSTKPLSSLRLDFLYNLNEDEWNDYNHSFKYNPYGKRSTHRNARMIAMEINHMLSPKMFYEIKLSSVRHEHGNYVFENPTSNRYVHDLFYRDTGPGFFTGGQEKDHETRVKTDNSAKFDFTWQMNREHSFKLGLHYIQTDLSHEWHQIRNLYYGTDQEPFMYEPVIMPDSSVYTDMYTVKPIEFSGYIQDKMEFDEMVINLGVRYDYFDPKTVYPSQRRNPANQLDYPNDPERMSTYPDADPKVQISPRFGISYQLNESALLRFSYGHFFQMPPLYAMYENHSFQVAPTDYETRMGNAQIKAQKTVQYEIGLWQEVATGMGVEVALFYRDIYDLLSAKVITTYNQIEYGLYSNKDYGNAKGLELKWDYVSGRFSAFLNYTLQYTRGNADNPTQTFDRAGNSQDPVIRLIPMSWDQRHTMNMTASYNAGKYGVTLTGYYNSGTPYTWEPLSESTLARVNLFPNNSFIPKSISLDLSSYYDVPLIKDVKMRFTLNVYNLLDALNEEWVNAQTGRAYTAIIRDTDLAAHHSDFNEFIDTVRDPGMYVAPRLVKLGVGFTF